MNIDSIDARLNEWNSDSAKLHTNLLELSSLYGYQLAGDGSTLTGTTKTQYLQASEKEAQLWKNTALFSDLLKRITEKRKALGFRPKGSALDEIRDLFEGDSIELPGEEVALQRRDLFSENRHVDRISARFIREQMKADFRSVCDFYDNLETTWRRLEESVSSAKHEADGVFAEASKYVVIGSGGSNAITILSEKLQLLSNNWRCDPLGMSSDLNRDIRPYLTAARTYVASLATEYAGIAEEVRLCKGKLAELAIKESRAQELCAACLSRYEFPSGDGPHLPSSSKNLAAQSERLVKLLSEKKWAELRLGLKTWTDDYSQISRITEEALATNAALVDKQSELKQRFFETVAKYKDYAQRGMAIPKSVETFTVRGQALLKGSAGKIDLRAAEAIVIALEVKVGELCLKFDS